MLYQLHSLPLFFFIALDLLVIGLLASWLRRPSHQPAKWSAIVGILLLTLPLSGYKLLFASPSVAASTPVEVVIKNPHNRFDRVYYLGQEKAGTWRVLWVEYLMASDRSSSIETEGLEKAQLAYQEAGQWHFAPVLSGPKSKAVISFPQGFVDVDSTGRIEAAVAAHRVYEYGNLLSNVLTLGSLVLLGIVVNKRLSPEKPRG
jgi:hypothetical protein